MKWHNGDYLISRSGSGGSCSMQHPRPLLKDEHKPMHDAKTNDGNLLCSWVISSTRTPSKQAVLSP